MGHMLAPVAAAALLEEEEEGVAGTAAVVLERLAVGARVRAGVRGLLTVG